MSPNEQFEQKSSYKQDHWEYFSFYEECIAMYKRCNPNMPNLPVSQVGYSLCLIYNRIFIELCPIIKQKRQRPGVTTISQRRTNNTFYRPAKIILCIWRVGNRIFPFSQSKHFFFSTSGKYRRLPIWLKTLNLKGYAAKYRKSLGVVRYP